MKRDRVPRQVDHLTDLFDQSADPLVARFPPIAFLRPPTPPTAAEMTSRPTAQSRLSRRLTRSGHPRTDRGEWNHGMEERDDPIRDPRARSASNTRADRGGWRHGPELPWGTRVGAEAERIARHLPVAGAGPMTRRIVVLGGGIAGLASALALARQGRPVTLIERDPPPPTDQDPFLTWERRGVPQFRLPHGFSARARNLLAAHAPGVLQRLRDDGIEEINVFKRLIPEELWQPSDDPCRGLSTAIAPWVAGRTRTGLFGRTRIVGRRREGARGWLRRNGLPCGGEHCAAWHGDSRRWGGMFCWG